MKKYTDNKSGNKHNPSFLQKAAQLAANKNAVSLTDNRVNASAKPLQKKVNINDDKKLEKEAEEMGAKAATIQRVNKNADTEEVNPENKISSSSAGETIQRYTIVQPEHLKISKGSTIETQDISQTKFGSTYVHNSAKVSS